MWKRLWAWFLCTVVSPINWRRGRFNLTPEDWGRIYAQLAQDHFIILTRRKGWLTTYLIVFATALGQQAWLYGVKGIGPSRAGVFVNLIPVSAVILSALVLGERIGAKELLGIVLILAGVWLVNWQSAKASETRGTSETWGERPHD